MNDDAPKTLLFAGAALVAVAAAVVATFALSSLARPAEFKIRLAETAGKVSLLEASSKAAAPRAPYGPDAACASADAAQLAAIEQRISALVATGGATVTVLTLTPADQARGSLTPIRLRLEATGSYDKVASVLGSLSGAAPRIFVDRLDLRDAGGATQLSLSSKVYCWSDARS